MRLVKLTPIKQALAVLALAIPALILALVASVIGFLGLRSPVALGSSPSASLKPSRAKAKADTLKAIKS